MRDDILSGMREQFVTFTTMIAERFDESDGKRDAVDRRVKAADDVLGIHENRLRDHDKRISALEPEG